MKRNEKMLNVKKPDGGSADFSRAPSRLARLFSEGFERFQPTHNSNKAFSKNHMENMQTEKLKLDILS